MAVDKKTIRKGMINMSSNSFQDYYNDDRNVSPAVRAKIEFEVELIGKLIAAREAKGMTQEQLAEAAGVKRSAVARLESLKATPHIDKLIKILTPLGYKLTIVPFDDNARSG
ncbi:MAG: helix-turn-helix transcriptional regulator [Clostridiales bacterium]|nr:helix-turn-helix transcriptional regulator [Clostridiales bacterium]